MQGAGNGKFYPATISKIEDDKVFVTWIDNDSKYRDVELDHIQTLSEKASSSVWIDAVVIGKVVVDDENDDDDGNKTEHVESYKVVREQCGESNGRIDPNHIRSRLRRPVAKSHVVLLVQRRNGIRSPYLLRFVSNQ